MLKIECNKGKMSCGFTGDINEITADMACCIRSVWKKLGECNKDLQNVFKSNLKTLFNDDMIFVHENCIEEKAKTVVKEIKEELIDIKKLVDKLLEDSDD